MTLTPETPLFITALSGSFATKVAEKMDITLDFPLPKTDDDDDDDDEGEEEEEKKEEKKAE